MPRLGGVRPISWSLLEATEMMSEAFLPSDRLAVHLTCVDPRKPRRASRSALIAERRQHCAVHIVMVRAGRAELDSQS